MKWLCRTTSTVCIVLGFASWSLAGQVAIQIHDGLVSLDARDATIREIFAEWARVGQTRVINAERAPGAPLTLQFQDVPERKALEIVLRSIAGYVAAPRTVAVQANASLYDRIVLMPATRPAVVPTSGTATQVQQPGGRRSMPEPPPVIVDDQDEPLPAAQMPIPGQPGAGAPQPGMMTTPYPQQAPYGGAGQQPNQPNNYPYPPSYQNPSNPNAPVGGATQQPQAPGPQSASRPGMPTAPTPPPTPPGPIK